MNILLMEGWCDMRILEIVKKFNSGELEYIKINNLIESTDKISLIIKNKRINKLAIIRENGNREFYDESKFIDNELNRLIRCIKAFNRNEGSINDVENVSAGLMNCGCHIMYMRLGDFITSVIIEQDKKIVLDWECDYSDC